MMRQSVYATAILAILTVTVSTTWAQRGPRPGGPPPGGRGGFNPLLMLFDADNDGVLSAEEIAGASAKLKEYDKSGDGKVTAEELREAMPFGRGPGAGGPPPFGRGGGPGGPPMAGGSSELQKEPLAQDDAEERILKAMAEMQAGQRYRNVSNTDGRLLRLLAEAVDAKRIVEIGTSTGESAVWLAMALQSTGGKLFTHEIDEGRAKTAQANFKKAGVDDLITLILGDAHELVAGYKDPDSPLFVDTEKGEAIDILFLDADKEGYIDYMNKLLPLLRPGGLVIAHNMNTRQADENYVKAITQNPELETLILLKEGTGVGVTLKKR